MDVLKVKIEMPDIKRYMKKIKWRYRKTAIS